MDRDHETFVVRPGLLRVVLLSVLLVLGATVFLFLAAVAGVIDAKAKYASAGDQSRAAVQAAIDKHQARKG